MTRLQSPPDAAVAGQADEDHAMKVTAQMAFWMSLVFGLI
jgi:hypothetical protein